MSRRVLVLGVTGMLGHTLFSDLTRDHSLDVHGSARSATTVAAAFDPSLQPRITVGVDAASPDLVDSLLDRVSPDVVINCIGVIKQDSAPGRAERMMAVNAQFPHRLADSCEQRGSRLVHISTDCVFSGKKGSYSESDEPDPVDVYGESKLLGELDRPSALTLRTSFIGHEIASTVSLVDWFLSQSGTVHGFTHAIYSGLTTVEFARLVRTVVLPREDLSGRYHVASTPVTKFDLLTMIAAEYGWPGTVVPSSDLVCDRSLVATRFHAATGYRPPEWSVMVKDMHGGARVASRAGGPA